MRNDLLELMTLERALLQSIDKPIYYVSIRYGDKYIISKEKYEKLNKSLTKLEKIESIIKCWNETEISNTTAIHLIKEVFE